MTWLLHTATGTYAVAMAPDDAGLVLADWTDGEPTEWKPVEVRGFRLPIDRTPLEYAALGTRQAGGSDLIVDHGNGVVGARLVWRAEDVRLTETETGSTLSALARDTTGDLGLSMIIEASREHDVIAKSVTISNTGSSTLALPRAFGPAWELPVGPGARIDYLYGDWSREFTPGRTELSAGELSIGSRQGITSHDFSPVVRVSSPADPDGPAYGIALAWSGSWRMVVDVPAFGDRVRVAGGVDDESGEITLQPGETFTTPATLGVFAPDGGDGLRRRWHDYQRGWLARDTSLTHRPIVYNSWYATTFDVELDHQLALADVAADLGVEAFVVDDGWFRGRTSDRSGLGDWQPDAAKFPDGLKPLVDAVTDRGMRFGIWVEPEAVNPDSDLFRAHPDWVYRAGERPLVTRRNQYVLDFGRPEVISWTMDWLRELLADERTSYLKWDMNRPVSDGGRPGDVHGRQWAVQHAEGYYAVMQMLREEFPHLTVEACSGGGGRIDLAVLAVSDVVWTSDETGARDRVAIQHGFLGAYGPHVMSSWVTDEPSVLDLEPVSFEFRFVVAMAGVLGIGSDILAWDDAQRARATELVALYRDVRETVHLGRVEQHGRPQDPFHAVEFGTDAQTVILVYARSPAPSTVKITPRTLAGAQTYRLRGSDIVRTGEDWAVGVIVPFTLAPDTDVLILEPVE